MTTRVPLLLPMAFFVAFWAVTPIQAGELVVAHAPNQVAPDSSSDETKKLHTLFDEEWQWTLRNNPEFATSIGDSRYDDRLRDLATPAIEASKAHKRDLLNRIRQIDRARLTGQDVLSYDLFLRETEQGVALQRFPSELMPISQMNGVQLSIPQLPRLAPLRSVKNYDDFLARLEAYPRQVDQIIELLKSGIAAGWMPPAVPIRKVLPQITKQLAQDVKQGPLYKPFESFPEAIGPADRSRLEARAVEAIKGSIVPGLGRLHQFMAETYLPACRNDIAATHLPDGEAYYQSQVRLYTTTDLSAREIHEIGLKEVGRIRAAMDLVIKSTGFSGSFPEFLNMLRTDPRFARLESDQVLPGFRDIAKQVDPELPKLFVELPRTPYGIREIPAYQGETAEHYTRGAADGSRAGYFNANVLSGATRRKYEMEALLLHEAVPGHHLQIARAQELKELPEFRRTAGYSAYSEGWGALCRKPGGGTRALQGPVLEVRPAQLRDPPRLPTGRRHRHARDGVVSGAGDHLSEREQRLVGELHRGGDRSLHRLASPGALVQDRRVADQGAARPGRERPRAQIRRPEVP